ncbi:amino acid ABC transporter substrate-binding protein [Methylobacterium soli]|uniref:Amino acid ABC transporter substrate-binding protein n=1 Tax=Methylobacterium soli TaxID=553447 RepID=A0A6L3T4A0_9HYPH|nr:amino acid ABC transporter substrate-binding protein [Methylobacterium soli]KAB1078067.1 amino acid ABC transporter substrate-binding protein [Methylobacterium soli]
MTPYPDTATPPARAGQRAGRAACLFAASFIVACLLATCLLALAAPARAEGLLGEIKARGYLNCGSSPGVAGFGVPDAKGEWRGLDIDFCRALASAIFDDPGKVRFVPLAAPARFTALQSGEIDVLARNTTWTLARDTSAKLNFPAINFYDGQGFLVRKDRGIAHVEGLDRATICLQQGTTTELNLADWFRTHGLAYKVVAFATAEETGRAYDSGRCDAYSTDKSSLYGERLKMAEPDAHTVLPETISKEPFSPVVRQGDDQWRDIVAWTHYAMLDAEEAGIGQGNVEAMRREALSPDIRRILGLEGKYGEALGLTNDWAYRIIRHVGNYGEVYARNLGADTPLKIPRGLNALWNQGGLQYGPPIR